MNQKVRRNFAATAVGAIACSLAFQPLASAAQQPISEDGNDLIVTSGEYEGRISGQSRFGTAVEASKALDKGRDEAAMPAIDTVILANNTAWSDTLAATPLADMVDAPVLYTYRDSVQADTDAELDRLADQLAAETDGNLRIIIAGGDLVVEPSVEAALRAQGYVVDRIGGSTRYETALMLAAEAVEYYEGTSTLFQAREGIRGVEVREAAYQNAMAVWEAARAKSDAALMARITSESELEAAQAVLTDLIDGLVDVPSATIMIDGVEYTVANLNDYNDQLIEFRNAASDLAILEGFVNSLLVQYVNAESDHFQDDPWTDVIDYFGADQLTVVLSSGTYTGTLAEHSDTTPMLSDSVDEVGAGSPVKAVEADLASDQADAEDMVTEYQSTFAAVVAQLNDIEDAIANNAALQRQIGDAQRVVEAAEADLAAKNAAWVAARDAEQVAKDAFLVAADNRPNGDDAQRAQTAYDDALDAVLVAAKKYPAFLATGQDFADALAAGPAASSEAGVVLLTRGSQMDEYTQDYLDSGSTQIAVGGPAAAAATNPAVEYVGYSRYETATLLADAYFEPEVSYVGLASGTVAADAVVGGALMSNVDGTIVLTKPFDLSPATSTFLSYDVDQPRLVIMGGPLAISNQVRDEAVEALTN